jgi:hypothetical protein
VADRDQIASTWPLLRAAQRAVDELAAAFGGGVASVPVGA